MEGARVLSIRSGERWPCSKGGGSSVRVRHDRHWCYDCGMKHGAWSRLKNGSIAGMPKTVAWTGTVVVNMVPGSSDFKVGSADRLRLV